MAGLLGTRDEHLRLVEQAFPDEQIVVQGNRITVEGPDAERVVRLFDELVLLVQSGQDLDPSTVARTIDMVARRHPPERGAALRGGARRRGQDGAAQDGRARSATPTPSRRTSSPSASGRPGPASRTWPWPWRCRPCSPGR